MSLSAFIRDHHEVIISEFAVLFIARPIVSAHGGDVQVRSSSDAGTTFTVKLPKVS